MKTRSLVSLLLLLLLTSSSTVAGPTVSFWKPVDSTVADRTINDATLADVNGDGEIDAIIAFADLGLVQVLRGTGDGRFEPHATYTVAPGRGDLVVTDVNRDNIADLLVASAGTAALLGRGDGTFDSPIYSPGGGGWMLTADFDGDGLVDIASVGKNYPTSGIPSTVDVYRGRGDGTFGPPEYLFVSDNGPRAIAADDLDNNGLVDLVIGESGTRALHVYLNQGNATFARAATAHIEVGPAATALADMDGNGTLDVVTADFSGSVSVLLGNGDGSLQAPRVFPVGVGCSGVACGSPVSLTVADIDLDGRLDASVALDGRGAVATLTNAGGGNLASPVLLETEVHATFVEARNVDGDGGIDIVAIHSAAAFGEAGTRLLSTYRNKARPRGNAGSQGTPRR